MIRKRIVARGLVQGVFYRAHCLGEAERHGVSGWVTNLPDGSVEAVLEGEPTAVDALIAWMQNGPPRARVEGVDVFDETPDGLAGFSIRD